MEESVHLNTPTIEDLANLGQVKRKCITFPSRICDDLDREIYIPYRYFTDLIIIDEFEQLPKTIQWLVVQLGYAIRVLGRKKPGYAKLYDAQTHLLKTAAKGEIDVRPTMIGISLSKSHLFKALEKLGRCSESLTSQYFEIIYPIQGFPTDYKKEFIYPSIDKSFEFPIRSVLRKSGTNIYLSEKGVVCFDQKLLELYPELKSEVESFKVLSTNILASPRFEDVHYAFVEV